MTERINNIVKNIFDFENYDKLVQYNSDLVVLGLNSIMAIQIVVALESEFHFEFDDEDLLVENFSSIEKIEDIVKKYLEGGE